MTTELTFEKYVIVQGVLGSHLQWSGRHSQKSALCTIYYGVALVSRSDTIIGLFCKRALQKRQYSAKETYNLSILRIVATSYGVATIRRLLDIVGLLCRISSLV